MRTTTRLSAITAALALATVAAPSIASAQGMPVRFNEVFNGRELLTLLYPTPEATGWPLSLAECNANTPIPIEVANVPTGTTLIDVWSASAASADCQNATTRATTTNTTCEYVNTFSAMVPITEADLAVRTLFGADACANPGVVDRTFFFFATTTTRDTATTFTAAQTGTLRIALDTQPPSAPTLSGTSFEGDESVDVGVTLPTGEVLIGVNVYVDPEGCNADGTVAEGGSLQTGEPAPTTGGDLQRGARATVNLTSAEYDTYAAVGIASVDQARNQSPLVVVCVLRVEVEGALSDYCRSKGFEDTASCLDEYECTVAGAGLGGRARMMFVAMLAAALFVLARRSRRK